MNNKPLSIIIDETRKNLVSICNNSGLPVIILESMLKNIYQEIKFLADQQLRYDTEEYNKFLIEEEQKNKVTEESDE